MLSRFPLQHEEKDENTYEGIDPIKAAIPTHLWPDKRYGLMDRFMDMNPFHFSTNERGDKTYRMQKWTDEEKVILQLRKKGYIPDEILQVCLTELLPCSLSADNVNSTSQATKPLAKSSGTAMTQTTFIRTLSSYLRAKIASSSGSSKGIPLRRITSSEVSPTRLAKTMRC